MWFAQSPPPLQTLPDLNKTVVYEVNIRAFSKDGNLAGVTAGLPRLKKLGVNVVWLMPIFPVGKIKAVAPLGSPYAVADYDRVNPEFGTEADLIQLVTDAHRRKMAVILDWVGNHTAWDSPWMAAHKDWYLQDAAGNPIPPPGTGWADVAKLTYDSKPMREAMIASMSRWVKQDGVDGFRCDAADMVPRDFWKSAIDRLRGESSHKLFFLAEGNRPADYTDGFDTAYGWDFYHLLKDVFAKGKPASDLAACDQHERQGLDSSKAPLRFSTNHDEDAFTGPPATIYGGPKAAQAAFAISCLYGGVPLIYNGQEVGWRKAIGFFDRDPIDWSTQSTEGLSVAEIVHLWRDLPGFRSAEVRDFSTKDVVAVERGSGNDRVVVMISVRSAPSSIVVPGGLHWQDHVADRAVGPGSTLTLEPFEICVLTGHPH